MWALGSYPTVAREIVAPLGPVLVTATEIQADDRVLDVAAGSGNVAIPAARIGAQVVATDLTPSLLSAGRRTAERAGVELTWTPADAEALPFEDGSFDAVVSAVGVMFAPHHQVAADELVRVCRRGGRIGLISWTPQGFVGQMFATMKPYVAPPPPGASPPPLWGNEEHVHLAARGPRGAAALRAATAEGRPVRASRGLPRLLQDPLTGRRSRPTGRWPTSRSGPPPSTPSCGRWHRGSSSPTGR